MQVTNSKNITPAKIEQTALVCHEANRAICQIFNDFSQKPWAEVPESQRDSIIKGVMFTINNPDASPEDQHNAWLADKVDNGWVYGSIKDTVAKTHPCLIHYSDLPAEQRVKDAVFQAIVRASLTTL